MRKTSALLLIMLLGGSGTSATTAAEIKAFASILPQQYFIEKIGSSHVDVEIMVEPGASPATYEPRPRQMTALRSTDVYFAIGVPFEKVWLTKIAGTNKNMRIVHTDAGIEKRLMEPHHHDDSGHAASPDPHIWLSPALVKIQARHIRDALIALDPANRRDYQSGYENLVTEISKLDTRIRQLFAADITRRFMVLHPSWGYFAADYGLEQIPVEVEGKEPKPAQLGELISLARQQGIKVIFAQPQFSTRSADVIARGIDGKVVLADPLAADWAANLWQTALMFKELQ